MCRLTDRIGAVGVRDRLALGHLADEHLAGLGERHHRRGRPAPLRVGDDGGLARLQDAHHRVRGPEVDSYGLGHALLLVPGSSPGAREMGTR